MNVMGISGTPREKGNSEILLRSALQLFKDNGWNVKMFLLSELTIEPCIKDFLLIYLLIKKADNF